MVYYGCIATWRDKTVECKLFTTEDAANRRMDYFKERDSIPVLKVEVAMIEVITTLATWIKPQDNSRLAQQDACRRIAQVIQMVPR